jgi:hypothetical protein
MGGNFFSELLNYNRTGLLKRISHFFHLMGIKRAWRMHQALGLGLFFRVTECNPVELLHMSRIHLQNALVGPGTELSYLHLPLPHLD